MKIDDAIDKQWLTTSELAQYLGRSQGAIRRWRQVGGGPPYAQPFGPKSPAYYDRADVDAWLRSAMRESASISRSDENV